MNELDKESVFTNIVLEVFKLGGLLVNEGDQMTSEHGMTSARWKILGAISLTDKPQTVPQIAKSMGLTRQAVQRLVDAMQKDGFVVFEANPDHKKAKLITLSKLGEDTYYLLSKKQSVWAKGCVAKIDKNELNTTLKVLKSISDVFDREGVEKPKPSR